MEIITKKQQFVNACKEAMGKDSAGVTLFIHMPTGEEEIIYNPNIAAKLAYIEKAYDDNLRLKSCSEIYIEEYHVHFPMEEVMDFGVALMNLKEGHRVARKGWNGKGMFLYYVPAAAYPPCTDVAKEAFGGKDVPYGAYLAMKTAQGNVVPWIASQTDMLAEDWVIL